MFSVEVNEQEKLLVAVTAPRLDVVNSAEFRDLLLGLLKPGHRLVMIDLSEVTYLDSSGLGALVSLRKRLGEAGVIKLVNLSPAVRRVFSLTGLGKVFTIFESRAQASQEDLAGEASVEMVARAIADSFNRKIPSIPEQTGQDNDNWKDWIEEARAAIGVMRNDLRAAGKD